MYRNVASIATALWCLVGLMLSGQPFAAAFATAPLTPTTTPSTTTLFASRRAVMEASLVSMASLIVSSPVWAADDVDDLAMPSEDEQKKSDVSSFVNQDGWNIPIRTTPFTRQLQMNPLASIGGFFAGTFAKGEQPWGCLQKQNALAVFAESKFRCLLIWSLSQHGHIFILLINHCVLTTFSYCTGTH
jgi:hypothetical protein